VEGLPLKARILVLLFAVAGFAQDNRPKHYVVFVYSAEYYKEAPPEQKSAYLSGWLDSRMNGGRYGDPRTMKAMRDCVQDRSIAQMVAIVDKYIQGHPETWQMPAATEADDALELVCPDLRQAADEVWSGRYPRRAPNAPAMSQGDGGTLNISTVTRVKLSAKETKIVIEGNGFEPGLMVHIAQYTKTGGWNYIAALKADEVTDKRVTAKYGGYLGPGEYMVVIRSLDDRLSNPERIVITTDEP
jgi:hypothetical protein